MATQSWIRSENFIDTATEENYVVAKEIFDKFEVNLRSGKADPLRLKVSSLPKGVYVLRFIPICFC